MYLLLKPKNKYVTTAPSTLLFMLVFVKLFGDKIL